MGTAIRQFVDGQFGQLHVRVAKAEGSAKRPLACLHMSPKSGRIFSAFIEAGSIDRTVFAHDYPGFGESDAPPADPPVRVEDYAQSLWDVADALGLGPIDILGYHTGSEVAAEAARQRPQQVGSIVMISAPVFTPEELQAHKDMFAEVPLDVEGTRFTHMWKEIVAHRGPGVSLETLAVSFAENLRAGEAYEWGHRAAFAYAPKFPDVVKSLSHPITVFNLQDDLKAFTPRIAPYLNNGQIIDRFEWGHGFLDAYTDAAVEAIRRVLDGG